MPTIGLEELRAKLTTDPLENLVWNHVLGGDPFVFAETPDDYELLRMDLSESLTLDVENFAIVGSAKLGYSLNPTSFGRPFGEQSDVDVVVIDHGRFDRMWYALVDWDYQLGPQEGWRKQWRRHRRDDVYWGWFLDRPLESLDRLHFPSALREVRDISNQWFDAFQSVGLRHPRLSGRKFSGRLYRTWQHAVSYHANNLRELRQALLPPEGHP